MRFKSIGLAFALCGLLSGVAYAQKTPAASKVGSFNDWDAYVASASKGKVCYAISQPTKKLPEGKDHGDVFFFVSDRPADGVTDEASIMVGYDFAPGSEVTVDIDGTPFKMFTKGDGAWVADQADEAKLLAAMRAGHQMTAKGKSARGTETSYTFSLNGVTAATDKIKSECAG